MDNEKLLLELYEKVNAWFEEKPQRPIAVFMLETILPYINDKQLQVPNSASAESQCECGGKHYHPGCKRIYPK